MSTKPADFFIGVIDFFAIILPGALLAYLALVALRQYHTPLGRCSGHWRSRLGQVEHGRKTVSVWILQTPNSGALILTAKSEETDNWIRYAEKCNRGKDLIVFNESEAIFHPLNYE